MRKRHAIPLLLALAGCAPAARSAPAPAPAAAPLRAALDSIFDDTVFASAFWGVEVRSLDSGETLYRRNAERLFIPASNMKIVTGAAALEALGPDYRYRTQVGAEGTVEGGELRGNLVVRGSGDPTIAAHFTGDPRAVFRAWADSLRARGITRVTGSIVGDDDVFDDTPLGRGWAWDDLDADYSAEIGGLEFNEGFVTVRVAPGLRPGDPARVALDPPTGYVPVVNHTTTVAPGTRADVSATRAPFQNQVVVSGPVPADTAGVETTVSVRDNTLYFTSVLRETLRDAGIRVDGPAVDEDARPDSVRRRAVTPLFTHTSAPLREILPGFLKPSQNQIGEILLKTLGHELRGQGSAAAGRAVVDSLLRTWGLNPRQLAQVDGSGLSRYDMVAPDLLIGILTHMTRSPNWSVWYAALPIAGVDGTLASRMKGTPLQGNVHAKTGTLSGVRSLSGYLTTAGGERLVFSAIANHHTVASRDVDRVAEAALRRIYEARRVPAAAP
ncbi:MAG: D-alanyl-D-alanine carboxypeptidase/D-alanyl-D-alanine-endopeptidase [Gemmatimonadetes bacterium]|nr:D-alanyl-D-alanine carboxypeptidase/D-alanyl-D-alanine-endopeptidase [Gemmatimonadota bacterium]